MVEHNPRSYFLDKNTFDDSIGMHFIRLHSTMCYQKNPTVNIIRVSLYVIDTQNAASIQKEKSPTVKTVNKLIDCAFLF